MDSSSQIDLCNESSTWLSASRIELVENLIQQLRFKNKELSIIDLGCGSGAGISTWRKYGQVDALEPGEEFLKILEDNTFIRHLYKDSFFTDNVQFKYDVVVCLDVIEHIEQDEKALLWIFGMLNKGGIAIFSVPAYQWLFSDHDRAVSHYRRYSRKSFKRKIPESAKVIKDSYFISVLFIPAVILRFFWQVFRIINNKFLNHEKTLHKQKSNYGGKANKIFSLIQKLDLFLFNKFNLPFGLSFICVIKNDN